MDVREDFEYNLDCVVQKSICKFITRSVAYIWVHFIESVNFKGVA